MDVAPREDGIGLGAHVDVTGSPHAAAKSPSTNALPAISTSSRRPRPAGFATARRRPYRRLLHPFARTPAAASPATSLAAASHSASHPRLASTASVTPQQQPYPPFPADRSFEAEALTPSDKRSPHHTTVRPKRQIFQRIFGLKVIDFIGIDYSDYRRTFRRVASDSYMCCCF